MPCGCESCNWPYGHRADSRFAPSRWETVIFCDDVSHWLGSSPETAPWPEARFPARRQRLMDNFRPKHIKGTHRLRSSWRIWVEKNNIMHKYEICTGDHYWFNMNIVTGLCWPTWFSNIRKWILFVSFNPFLSVGIVLTHTLPSTVRKWHFDDKCTTYI